MILVKNDTREIVIQSGDIQLLGDRAIIGGVKYFAGISKHTHHLVDAAPPAGDRAEWYTYDGGFHITLAGLESKRELLKEELILYSDDLRGANINHNKLVDLLAIVMPIVLKVVNDSSLLDDNEKLSIAQVSGIIGDLIDGDNDIKSKSGRIDNAITSEDLDAIRGES